MYPASTGRNFDELLRVVDSLQLTDYQKLAIPATWNNGDDCVIVPAVKNEEFSASNKVLGSVSHFFVLLVFAKFILPLLTLEYVCKYLNSNKKP